MPDLGSADAFDDIKTIARLPAWPMGAGSGSPAEKHGPYVHPSAPAVTATLPTRARATGSRKAADEFAQGKRASPAINIDVYG
jgi:hypothetical protein